MFRWKFLAQATLDALAYIKVTIRMGVFGHASVILVSLKNGFLNGLVTGLGICRIWGQTHTKNSKSNTPSDLQPKQILRKPTNLWGSHLYLLRGLAALNQDQDMVLTLLGPNQ